MNSRFVGVLALMAVTLVACSQGGSGSGKEDCSEGVCVGLRVVEPVQFNQPIVVQITVTSEQDRPDLGLTLYTDGIQATIEGPQGWESNVRKGIVFKDSPVRDAASWGFDAKAKVPVQFTRVLHFSDKDQLTDVNVALNVPPRTFVAFAHATIRYLREGVQVYGMGTPFPLRTSQAPDEWSPWIVRPDGTRIPAPTLLPTPTFGVHPRPTRTPTAVVPIIPTPTGAPYP